MWKGLQDNRADHPEILDTHRDVHLANVRKGDYAYITDRTTIERVALADTECKLQLLQDTFLPMNLGIGLQEGVKYRRTLEKAYVSGFFKSNMMSFDCMVEAH